MANNGGQEIDNTIEDLWSEAATQIANINSGELMSVCSLFVYL